MNKMICLVVGLMIMVTVVLSFTTLNGQSRLNVPQSQPTPPVTVRDPKDLSNSHSREGEPSTQNDQIDLSKYPVADYDASDPANAAEREHRKEIGKRYDKRSFVMPNPRPEFMGSTIFHAEPVPAELPFGESQLVMIGQILSAKAYMSNDRSAVYSEYAVQIETIIKPDSESKLHKGQLVSVDRMGGRVRYPNGQTILYLNDWEELPESMGHYLFFLSKNDSKNPNYKIVTAYQFKNGKVAALDRASKFRDHNGRARSEFVDFVLKTYSAH